MMKKLSLILLFAAFSSLFATQAFANSIDFRLGGNFSLIDYSNDIQYGYGDPLIGGTANLEVGINWGAIGLYINQDLGAMHDTGDTQNYMKSIGVNKPKFYGATYFMLKAFYLTSAFTLDFGVGLGVMYGQDNPNYCLIPRASTSEAAAQFAFKVTFGMTFDITAFIGIGFHVDYAMGIYDEYLYTEYGDDFGATHNFMPGLHVVLHLF